MADIHFDHRLALACLDAGAAAIRLNPGNITRLEHWADVGREMAARGVPARVGVNAGSLDEAVVEEYGGRTAEAMAASAVAAARRLEDVGVEDLIMSAKATSPALTLEANRLIAEHLPYPLHVGITEAGFGDAGVVRSAAGLALILAAGLGDTVRVSLTDEPAREVAVAYEILRTLDLRRRGPTLISCPGCGRAQVDIAALARSVAESLNGETRDVVVAVMGCAVNGPGEAREADVGVAGGKGRGVVYRRGEIVRPVDEDELVAALLEELGKLDRP
jgi:(E)-4-hydroxy-3-methylbut-2-enyl-diphosphate synthase